MRKELFHELYVAHWKQVFSYLLGRIGNKELAADLLQDTFLKVWNRMETVERIPEQERLYWIFAVAANRLKDHYRKSAHRRKAEEHLLSEPPRQEAGDLAALLAGQERFRELEKHILQLPEELRCILLMKVLGGMNSSEIGHALQQPPGTIRYKIARARRILADMLGLLKTEPLGKGVNAHG